MDQPSAPLLAARFNPLIRPYLVVTIGLTMLVSCIGIPLAPFWFLGLGQWWARHYFQKLECHLNERTLRYRKGILFQVEKTIPLENIQDITFLEGPILRRFQLSTLKLETAGHSAGQAGDMQLTGIIDAHEFRDRILLARDALKRTQHVRSEAPAHAEQVAGRIENSDLQLAAMRGIERRLDEILALLRQRG